MSNTESRSYFGLIRRSSEKMDILGFFARIKMTLTGNAALTVIRAGRSPTSLIRGPNRADLARVAASDCPGVHATPSAAAFLLARRFPVLTEVGMARFEIAT